MAPQPTPSGPLRVLIVEDDASNRDVMRMVLELAGHLVSTADTGSDALVRAAEEKPDAVLLDMSLPDTTGESVSAALRSSLSPAPRIIITTGLSLGTADRTRLGADAILLKPFGADRLLAVVSSAFRSDRDGVIA